MKTNSRCDVVTKLFWERVTAAHVHVPPSRSRQGKPSLSTAVLRPAGPRSAMRGHCGRLPVSKLAPRDIGSPNRCDVVTKIIWERVTATHVHVPPSRSRQGKASASEAALRPAGLRSARCAVTGAGLGYQLNYRIGA